MADFQDNLDEAPTVVELCGTVARLPRQFQAQEHKNSELADAAYSAGRSTAAGFSIPTSPTPEVTTSSDWQLVNLHGI